MTKRITDNQILGELGETTVKKIAPETEFIYEHRGRLEAGTGVAGRAPHFLPALLDERCSMLLLLLVGECHTMNS